MSGGMREAEAGDHSGGSRESVARAGGPVRPSYPQKPANRGSLCTSFGVKTCPELRLLFLVFSLFILLGVNFQGAP